MPYNQAMMHKKTGKFAGFIEADTTIKLMAMYKRYKEYGFVPLGMIFRTSVAGKPVMLRGKLK